MKRTIFTILIFAVLQVMLSSMVGMSSFRNKYEPCDENKYQGNMILIAQVRHQTDTIFDCEVAVFDSNGECRASEKSKPNDNGLVYLTIQGEGQGEPLTFRAKLKNLIRALLQLKLLVVLVKVWLAWQYVVK